MSGSVRAMGQAVEAMFLAQSPDFHVQGNWFTVGQVAEQRCCTKKTARKYLEILREAGVLERYSIWGSKNYATHVYRLSTERYLSYYVGRDN